MAKRRGKATYVAPGTDVSDARERSRAGGVQTDTPGRVGRKVEDFAEDLGRLLGTAERKASEWLSQREDVAKQLTQLREKATQLLSQLGLSGASASRSGGSRRGRARGSAAAPARRGRPPGSGKKKRTMSPEARERIAAAQRKRWAKVKRAKKAAS